MKTIDNQKHYSELMLMIKNPLDEVISVEGQIKSVGKFGHCAMITFENGKVYKQPLISLYGTDTNRVTLDIHKNDQCPNPNCKSEDLFEFDDNWAICNSCGFQFVN